MNTFSKCLLTAAIGLGAVVLPVPLIAISNNLMWQLSYLLPTGLMLPILLGLGVLLYGAALYALIRIWRQG